MDTVAAGDDTETADTEGLIAVPVGELDDDQFTTVVKESLFNPDPEVVAWFYGPGIERYFSSLQSMAAGIHRQLQTYAEAGPHGTFDESWRQRAGGLYARVGREIAKVRPVISEKRRRENGVRAPEDRTVELKTYVGQLRGAIFQHRLAAEADGRERSAYDEALWAMLEPKE